ncbi:MAG: hypothetical protein BGN88_06805 [Clostridiales bacterium 43-6]|nr:MAG: hypothetical protein BGN88_06805 [Clostridiales bacterium 43-6]
MNSKLKIFHLISCALYSAVALFFCLLFFLNFFRTNRSTNIFDTIYGNQLILFNNIILFFCFLSFVASIVFFVVTTIKNQHTSNSILILMSWVILNYLLYIAVPSYHNISNMIYNISIIHVVFINHPEICYFVIYSLAVSTALVIISSAFMLKRQASTGIIQEQITRLKPLYSTSTILHMLVSLYFIIAFVSNFLLSISFNMNSETPYASNLTELFINAFCFFSFLFLLYYIRYRVNLQSFDPKGIHRLLTVIVWAAINFIVFSFSTTIEFYLKIPFFIFSIYHYGYMDIYIIRFALILTTALMILSCVLLMKKTQQSSELQSVDITPYEPQ